MSPPGMLFSQMDPPPGAEDAFHDWYETDHIPARIAIDGFEQATRYRAIDGSPTYLAIYELADLGVLERPAYEELKRAPSPQTTQMLARVRGFTRFTCELVSDSGSAGDHGYLFAVAFAVPPAVGPRFDDWYEAEHIPILLAAEDWLRVRRYRVQSGEGGPWTDIALHELRSTGVMHSPERAAARGAPKRRALADQPWFRESGRWLYEVLTRHG